MDTRSFSHDDSKGTNLLEQISKGRGSRGKRYLNIPYSERNKAKVLGARWDPTVKSWWVGPENLHYNELIVRYDHCFEDHTPCGAVPMIKTDSDFYQVDEAPHVRSKKLDSGSKKLDSRDRPIRGFVYCAKCPSQPGLIKIGQTTRCPLQRMKELSNTSVAFDFELVYFVEVSDPRGAEDLVHRALVHKRINPDREFFKLSEEEAKTWVSRAGEEYPVATYISLGSTLTDEERLILQLKLEKFRNRGKESETLSPHDPEPVKDEPDEPQTKDD